MHRTTVRSVELSLDIRCSIAPNMKNLEEWLLGMYVSICMYVCMYVIDQDKH